MPLGSNATSMRHALNRPPFSMLACLLLSSPFAAAAGEPETWPLWEDPPGEQATPTVQTVTERSEHPEELRDRIVTGVTEPRLALFDSGVEGAPAVIMIPGGAYRRVVLDKEGYETAEWFAARGVTAFVLLYRLPGDTWTAGPDTPLQDTQRAVRWVRHNAGDFGVDPGRVGVVGFSAGGHATAALVTRFDDRVYAPVDAADRLSARPDFAALVYPVVSMRDGLAHELSREKLLGADFTAEDVARHSPERHVPRNAPPTLLIHSVDDASVPVGNSLAFHAALLEAGVPAELHVFSEGGHGFGLRYTDGLPVAVWPELLERWMWSLWREGKGE